MGVGNSLSYVCNLCSKFGIGNTERLELNSRLTTVLILDEMLPIEAE